MRIEIKNADNVENVIKQIFWEGVKKFEKDWLMSIKEEADKLYGFWSILYYKPHGFAKVMAYFIGALIIFNLALIVQNYIEFIMHGEQFFPIGIVLLILELGALLCLLGFARNEDVQYKNYCLEQLKPLRKVLSNKIVSYARQLKIEVTITWDEK
jgi:hypothetical protein